MRALFIKVNRLLAPPEMSEAFEGYIQSSLQQEMDRIAEYYADKKGQFWVALYEDDIVGMYGLEPSGSDAMELRRLYVDPACRRRGIGRMLVQHAEEYCRTKSILKLDLSTSELQSEALSLYQNGGYELIREEVSEEATNKSIGGGIRRFHFIKDLSL